MRSSAGGSAGGEPRARVQLRPGAQADVVAVAALHAGAISEGFLSSLGARFLARLYARILRSPESFLLVAADGDAVAGFIAGSLSVRALYRRFLVHDGAAAALGALPRLVTSLPRVLETLRHGAPSSGPGAAELLSVAVGAPWRGTGVGAELVRGFLAELERRGAPMARVVLGADNTAAEELYRRAGFRTARTFEMHRGTTSLVMERAVAGGGAARPAPEH